VNSRRSRFVKFNATAMALRATVLLVSAIAHITFTGLSAVDMTL
jgi:hypothetical protein